VGSFRLFRRIKIARGVTINVSKSGLSTSFGPKGAKVTVGRRGVRKTVGIPGTGMYYTSTSGRLASSAPPSGSRSWIAVLVGSVILAVIVGSCLGGNSGDPASSAPPTALALVGPTSAPRLTQAPLATEAPTTTSAATPTVRRATPKPTDKPTVTPKPTPAATAALEPAPLSVKVTNRTASVRRGGTASVTIKTAPRAACSIDVEYASGSSTAAGLGDKTASSTGFITWKWKVGSNTTRGTWPIYITCELGDRSGSVDTEFTVR
jgi:hypothetical protein